MNRAQLHLIDAKGSPVGVAIRDAVEEAYRLVVRDFPDVDPARIADWAEGVAAAMQVRESAIDALQRYAYVAIKGKIRDWRRTLGSQEQLLGTGLELDRKGGRTVSFQGAVERKILWEQLTATLGDRDRYILALLLEEKSAIEIASDLGSAYPATRKAIQRVKERLAMTAHGEREKNIPGHGPTLTCEAKG